MASKQYLLRMWGRDLDQITALHTPEEREDGSAACYWFETAADRQTFLTGLPPVLVVWSQSDPGYDSEGELIEPLKRTIGHVTLRFPNGDLVSYDEDFGYGYPEHGARYMYEEGNYSCDCNRRLFAARYANYPVSETDDEKAEVVCGDTITLVSLTIEKIGRPS